jgi:hypothetical protein
MSKRAFFCLNVASGTLHEDLGLFYFRRRYKFAIKALLCNIQYFYLVDKGI